MSALADAKQHQTSLDISFLNQFFWKWYHEHSNDRVLTRKILVITINVHVKDLSFLFVLLFGHDPS